MMVTLADLEIALHRTQQDGARRAKPSAPEQALQKTIVEWLRLTVPPPPWGPLWTAINPVPSKTKAVAGLCKALGMRAGVFDLLLVWKGRAIFIELKAPKRGRLSPGQKAFAEDATLAGALTYQARSLEAFVNVIGVLGIPTRQARLTTPPVPAHSPETVGAETR